MKPRSHVGFQLNRDTNNHAGFFFPIFICCCLLYEAGRKVKDMTCVSVSDAEEEILFRVGVDGNIIESQGGQVQPGF